MIKQQNLNTAWPCRSSRCWHASKVHHLTQGSCACCNVTSTRSTEVVHLGIHHVEEMQEMFGFSASNAGRPPARHSLFTIPNHPTCTIPTSCSLLGRGTAVANAIDQGLANAAQRRAQREASQSNAELRIAARIKDPMSAPGNIRFIGEPNGSGAWMLYVDWLASFNAEEQHTHIGRHARAHNSLECMN
eukprot:491548-Pelagomonas_calceolata.AAC.2